MNLNSTNIKLLIGVMLFVAWVLLVVFKVPGSDDLIASIKLALLGLGAYHLNDRTNAPDQASLPAASPPANSQAGFANPLILGFITMAMMLCLAGCAGFQQALTGYESAALKGLQSAEDNNIAVWATNACGTPFSAAIRHPEVIPVLRVLCLPSGAASNPSTLLDAVPVPGTTK